MTAEAGPVLLDSFGSNSNKLALQLSEYAGTRLLDIRKCFVDKSGKLLPTKKGIALSRQHFQFLLSRLEEHEARICDWLDHSPAILDHITTDKAAQARATTQSRYAALPYAKETRSSRSPEFFNVSSEGGRERLVLNSRHKFIERLEELLGNVESADDAVRKEAARQLRSLVDLLLLSLHRSLSVQAGPDQESLDSALWDWGPILSNYMTNPPESLP